MIFLCCESLAPYAKEYYKDSNIKVVVNKPYVVDCEERRINVSNDISTMYTKDRNMKTGRKGYAGWQVEKEKAIRPSDYGDYILQRRKRGKRK